LKSLDSLQSLNSIFRGIANRINTREQLKELKDLIVIYDINEATEDAIMEITEENLLWRETYSGEIQEFLDDFFRNSSTLTSTVPCFIILFGLALNWIMQN
jgi:hypothetical protein